MRTLIFALLSTLVACAPAGSSEIEPPTEQLAPGTATLVLDITNVRNASGTVYCALFQSARGFPGASPIIGGALSAPARVGTIRCAWSSLPPGEYAVSVYHDENSNQRTDTSPFGAPTEGYGASRNNLPAAAAPTFDENKLRVDSGANVTGSIQLRY